MDELRLIKAMLEDWVRGEARTDRTLEPGNKR
jgi:hypothetical protein